MRTQLMASALVLVVNASAHARDLNPSTDEGAAAAGLIQFYSQRCGGGSPGYFLTSRALAFVNTAASARPRTFHAGYATEARMPTQLRRGLRLQSRPQGCDLDRHRFYNTAGRWKGHTVTGAIVAET